MSENLRHFCSCLTVAGNLSRRAALLNNSRWESNEQISIRFLEGDPQLQERVRRVALEWTKEASLTFQFVAKGQSDIRIAFAQGNGSWSQLGTMCRDIDEPRPTMNFGWLTPSSDDTTLRRVVLHEFGHALGLLHEHQNPRGRISWNRKAVIADLSAPPGNWTPDMIERNVFKQYEAASTTATVLDPQSIMTYAIPAAWTTDGFSVQLNTQLSEMDKQLIRSVYPPR